MDKIRAGIDRDGAGKKWPQLGYHAYHRTATAENSSLEWHFAEQRIADLMREAVEDSGLLRVDVFFTPMP